MLYNISANLFEIVYPERTITAHKVRETKAHRLFFPSFVVMARSKGVKCSRWAVFIAPAVNPLSVKAVLGFFFPSGGGISFSFPSFFVGLFLPFLFLKLFDENTQTEGA